VSMARRVAEKLLLIGWDAADWTILRPLMAKGWMPNLSRLVAGGASRRPNGLMVETARAADAAAALTAAGLGPVTASQPEFVFDVDCPSFAELKHRVL